MASLGDIARVPVDVEKVLTENLESDEDAPTTHSLSGESYGTGQGTTQSTTNTGMTVLKAKGQPPNDNRNIKGGWRITEKQQAKARSGQSKGPTRIGTIKAMRMVG